MTLRKLTGLAILALLLSCLGSNSASASYAAQITTPTPPFSAIPGGTLACGGWVDWTFPLDIACYNVKVTLFDGAGHSNSTWATCSVGYSSTSWSATVSAVGLVPSDGALLLAKAYDNNLQYLDATADADIEGKIDI